MNNLILPSGYISESIFAKEQKLIFQDTWQFVGFVNDLANHNDFVTRLIGGKPIVIQNFKGELRAFVNICRHRHSAIQCSAKGNRHLSCPYHGWTYDSCGVARGIPNKDDFDINDFDNLSSITLLSYRVDTCGSFVFIASKNQTKSLEEHLGESRFFLAEISNSFGEKVDEFKLLKKSNWKICIENTLDSYHVDVVHKTSLANIIAQEQVKIIQQPHSHTIINLSENSDRRRCKINSLLADRPCKFNGYIHHLIFPNLTIATTQGTSFSVQSFEPIAAGLTQFTTSVFEVDYNSCPKAISTALAKQVAKYNRQVFLEDQIVCESVQQGLEKSEDSHPGLMNIKESRILSFQSAYNEIMFNHEFIKNRVNNENICI